jgi:Uma2 family endonuclease
MSAAVAPVPRRCSPEEYLALERASETKHEYFRGRIIEMAGMSEMHNVISHNIGRELGNLLKDRPCKVYQNDMRVRCPTGLYAYPDVAVACGEAEVELDNYRDTLLNPIVIVKVSLDRSARPW